MTTFGRRGIRRACDALPPEGADVPAFDFRRVDGGRSSAAQLRGRPAVLALWSSTCSSSRDSLAAIAALQARYGSRGVQFVIIADDADPAPVTRVLDSAGVELPVALAEGRLTATFAPNRRWPWQPGVALPSFLVLDAEGRIRRRIVGLEADSSRRMERVCGALEQLLARS